MTRFQEFAERDAIIWKDKPYSYAHMSAETAAWRSRLSSMELEPGTVVGVHGDGSPSLVALLIALVLEGHTALPISSGVGAAEREERLATGCAALSVHFDVADAWKADRREPAGSHPLLDRLRQAGEPGLILFSSGSTGKEKGIVHNFSRLLAKHQGGGKPYRGIVLLLIDHIGGVNTLFSLLASGGAAVLAPSRRPTDVLTAVERHRVQLLPATPSFIHLLLLSEDYARFDLSSLELITYGTEPMHEHTLKHASRALPGVRFKQTYGLSELGIMATKSEGDDSLWLKLGGNGFQYKIEGDVLWVKADSAMLGYLNAPDPFDAKGWFNTGDLVETRGEYIRILGRGSEMINVGGQKVNPSEVESVLHEMENVREALVYGERNDMLGSIVCARLALLEPEDPALFKRRMRLFCRERLANYKIPMKLEFTAEAMMGERLKKRRAAGSLGHGSAKETMG